ncbi:MAG TPA: preprotein translocase subunit SecE [Saprospiraceae bacterium]|nr:preprotein translocase subunit SecE [Saprospiraceae bacterium]
MKESYDELVHKVEWPTGVMLVQSTVATIVGLLILSLLVLGMDGLNKTLFDFIYKIK